jgi:hypothetical protein
MIVPIIIGCVILIGVAFFIGYAMGFDYCVNKYIKRRG